MDKIKLYPEDDGEYEVRAGDVKWVDKDDLEEMALRAHFAPSVEDAYRHRENRIEALRAASRVVAQHIYDIPGQLDYEKATLDLAKTFAKYLEGE